MPSPSFANRNLFVRGCKIRLKSLLKFGTSRLQSTSCAWKLFFSSVIYIQYRVWCKPWSPISILQRCKIVNFTNLIVASTIIGIRFYRIGHVLHYVVVRYFQIVHIRSLFKVLAGDTCQGNPQKVFQPVQGHSLGTEIAKKLHYKRRHSSLAM